MCQSQDIEMFTEFDVMLKQYNDPIPGNIQGYVGRILNKLGSPQRICAYRAQSLCLRMSLTVKGKEKYKSPRFKPGAFVRLFQVERKTRFELATLTLAR